LPPIETKGKTKDDVPQLATEIRDLMAKELKSNI